jgi:hypothetical protein
MIGSRQDNKSLLYIRYLSSVTCFGHLRIDEATPRQGIRTGWAQASCRASLTDSARNQTEHGSDHKDNTHQLPAAEWFIVRQRIPS